MAQPYNSPGVSVFETVVPAVAGVVASPQIVAIVGYAAGQQSASERIILTTSQQLAYAGVHTNSVVVKLAATGETLDPGNYTVAQTSDPDTTVTGDELYTITRVASPSVADVAVASGTGTLTGTYEYAYSFVNANGETGISPSSGPVAIAGAGFNLSAIGVGAAGTTARKIYRKKTIGTSADSTFHLVATIPDNVTTTLTNETTADATANLASTPKTGIVSGDTIVVTYTYTDSFYYKPTTFDDYADVVDKYGSPFDSTTGAISSPLSFAIREAFVNGASEVIAVAALTDTQADIETGLSYLLDEPDVRIVAVANGGAFVSGSVYAHCVAANAQGHYRFGIVGRDGSGSIIAKDVLRTAADALNVEQIRYVNISSIWLTNPVTGAKLTIGGQYAAAAVAGMYAARDVQIPLTRKTVAGFEGINDTRTESDKALDSNSGLLVIEDRGGVLRIRHDITTATGNVNTRESSVVRAKYEMAHRVKDALDQGAVGMVATTDVATTYVEGLVRGTLDGLVLEQAIEAFGDIKARVLAGDPTTIEVRFQYKPMYPINNIVVIFTINTTTGDFTVA